MNFRTLSDCAYEQTLKKDVIDADRCCRCGTCGAVCPKQTDTRHYNPLMKGRVRQEGDPARCDLCAQCCPINNRAECDGIGTMLRAVSASAAEGHRLPGAQDGGACGAFLASLDGYDIAAVGHDAWTPAPRIAPPGDQRAGTVYAATSSLSLLPKKRGRVAFGGMPCQMRGITLAQERGLLGEIALKVGLFCTKTFDHAALHTIIEGKGIPIASVRKMSIKSSLLVTDDTGTQHAIGLPELADATVPGCAYCPDFCAWYADIAFGSVGSQEGYTTVLIRDEAAGRLFDDAVRRKYINIGGEIDIGAVELHQQKKREGYAHE